MIPEFKICAKREVEPILLDFVEREKFKYLISIGDPDEGTPRGYLGFFGPKLRLQFDDVHSSLEDYDAASAEQIEQLIDFCERIDGPTLIHCYAGISRSAAAACVLTAIKMGPGREEEAIRHVESVKSSIHPNKHVLNLADQLLDRQGKLLLAAFSVFPQPIDTVELVTIPTLPRRRSNAPQASTSQTPAERLHFLQTAQGRTQSPAGAPDHQGPSGDHGSGGLVDSRGVQLRHASGGDGLRRGRLVDRLRKGSKR